MNKTKTPRQGEPRRRYKKEVFLSDVEIIPKRSKFYPNFS